MNLRLPLIIKILFLSSFQYLYADYSSRDEVNNFIEYMSEKHEFSKSELKNLFDQAEYQEKVVRIMNRQPEGTMTWGRYKGIMINDSRISAGKEFIESYGNELKRAEDIYGVPAEIIASIIGIETRYGRIKGNTRVIDSLSTLASIIQEEQSSLKFNLKNSCC